MRRVVVLRPEPGASATAARARALGLDVTKLPLFRIEPVAWHAPDPADFDGLLLTSANALRQGGKGLERLHGLPVHAVGSSTADATREAGFDVATTGRAGVDELLDGLGGSLKLLHLCGEDRSEPQSARHHVVALPVYRAAEREGVEVAGASGTVVLVHSPRAARRFGALIDSQAVSRAEIAIAAISPAAARAAGPGWAAVEAAEAPSDDALLPLAQRLCNNVVRT